MTWKRVVGLVTVITFAAQLLAGVATAAPSRTRIGVSGAVIASASR